MPVCTIGVQGYQALSPVGSEGAPVLLLVLAMNLDATIPQDREAQLAARSAKMGSGTFAA
jgi:hypothetical protein